jgi:hypothetical protein
LVEENGVPGENNRQWQTDHHDITEIL